MGRDLAAERALIKKSGLFDSDFYVKRNNINLKKGESPVRHYLEVGVARGFQPHPLFDSQRYLRLYPHVSGDPLAHFIQQGHRELRSPHPLFDIAFYLGQRPDIAAAGINPLWHYLNQGYLEGAEPSPQFDGAYYMAVNGLAPEARVNPLLHYVLGGGSGPFLASAVGEILDARLPALPSVVGPSPEFVGPPSRIDDRSPAVRAIAFYLPQFHPIPENDEWWGRGFTEWANASKAVPRYAGHYQPHLPGELGFYDLRLPSVQERQAELARQYGLHGFCFYFYWFGGKTLLEQPIKQYFQNDAIDFPACLCWANENWTRRWDGKDSEVLIGQDHSASDDLAFIEHLSSYLKNSKYIRIDGRPLVVVYRPGLLPDPAATAELWRAWCRDNGIGEIYLAYVQSFESVDPALYGFDGAIEFPPNGSGPPNITDTTPKAAGFQGTIYDYRVYPERGRSFVRPEYSLFRGVFPSWDNEARRPGRGTSFLHATPKLYQEWLTAVASETRKNFPNPDERLVFINAWNEWAEGAHLEPDQRFGYAWLQATRNALLEAGSVTPGVRPVVLFTHDGYPHGAQYIALNICRALHKAGVLLEIVTLGSGPLLKDFQQCGRLHDFSSMRAESPEAKAAVDALVARGVASVITNTVVTGLWAPVLRDAGLRVVSLVHELPGVIASYGLHEHVRQIAAASDEVVFPARYVQDRFVELAPEVGPKSHVQPQGLYKRNQYQSSRQRRAAREALRKRLGISQDARVILGVAFGDERKGIDLFCELANLVSDDVPNAYFVWVGEVKATLRPEIDRLIGDHGLADRVKLVGFQSDTDLFYAGADVYALTSREDPFPSVVMEAMDVSVPVVGFEGAGGFNELLKAGAGISVPDLSVPAMSAAVVDLLRDEQARQECGARGKALLSEGFSYPRYAQHLLKCSQPEFLRVSVVVPNYNYARYLVERLDSISKQSYPIFEVVILDDFSKDSSIEVIDRWLRGTPLSVKLIRNSQNSGSVFRQWLRGVEAASGDVVWIAEADDLAEEGFVAAAIGAMYADPKVVLSFTQSKMIDEAGRVIGDNYLNYTSDVDAEKWGSPYIEEGVSEIASCLSVKNTIPNVSAVLMRREALLEVLKTSIDEIASYRVVGDWCAYIGLLQRGRIAFEPQSFNRHRRHASSVTLNEDKFAEQLHEIETMQSNVARRFAVHPQKALAARMYVAGLKARRQ